MLSCDSDSQHLSSTLRVPGPEPVGAILPHGSAMNQAHYHPITEAGVAWQRGSAVPTVTGLASAGGAGLQIKYQYTLKFSFYWASCILLCEAGDPAETQSRHSGSRVCALHTPLLPLERER